MDKKKKWLKITLGIMALVIVGVYIGGIAAFHGKFLKNTDINGMDVSDMTVEEAEKLIREQAEDYQITLKERGNNSESKREQVDFIQNVYIWTERKEGGRKRF